MKGNIIRETRNVVNTMYREGCKEVYGISIIGSDTGTKIEIVDFFMNPVTLPRDRFDSTYSQAEKTLKLAKARCGSKIMSISALVGNEEAETMFTEGRVLRIFNLNCLYIKGGDTNFKNTVGESVRC